jgi:hypothetical protein
MPFCSESAGKISMIPGALIDDSSGDKGSWYRAPGWRAAARQKDSYQRSLTHPYGSTRKAAGMIPKGVHFQVRLIFNL